MKGMSGRGKRKDEDDHASDGDSEGHPPPKKASKKNSSDDSSDDITVCEISKNRRVSVRNWNGKVVVDIREFYVKDGKQMPGKKGISLTMDQWDVLRNHVEEIDKAVNET
ncbi:RNA polymerase II transcriptional coactivator KIWI-like [Pyrus x bretschneideri]|uniref:RNA polymerase II transcriptional coactivator KIWI-like n=1 Tax=Pyrus x bretschneideri TaxID=225117 RepID=UPI00202EEA28|nr:RNA polymerase II transcriptional coactivator KIWI-like [Pyrus x bretschneideri]